MSIRFTNGTSTVTMSDTVANLAKRALRETAPAVLDRLQIETKAVYDRAYRDWPVKTGTSREALQHFTQINVGASVVEGVVINEAKRNGQPYAFYIRSVVNGKYTNVHTALLRKPMQAAATRMAHDMAPLLKQLWEG